jgi:hypothetical protein
VSSKNLRERPENLLPGKELGSVICYYGSDESVNIVNKNNKIFINIKQKINSHIQGVPELADQIETVYSLMVMKVKNV